MIDKKTQGKKNREAGRRFEKRVRADLEKKGWIVDRWTNNVEFNIEFQGDAVCTDPEEVTVGKLIPAKPKFVFNPAIKRRIPIGMSSGFPDFIAFNQLITEAQNDKHEIVLGYELIGVEVKSTGKLDKEEREKCRWYLNNQIFSSILIAKKGEKKGSIIYEKFDNNKF